MNKPVTADQFDAWVVDEARRIVLSIVDNTPFSVYLFGSRAKGEPRRFSDIDIAIDGHGASIPDSIISEINERLEESTIPYTIDVIDLSKVPDHLVNKVKHEGIKWKD